MRHDTLRAICEQHPSFAAAFWRSTLIDAAIYGDGPPMSSAARPSPAWRTSYAG
ncbi:hypothetical protein [Mesorhizobium sp. M7A.F.Ca.US.014.04.1.1]|uniref:hypothetical protein n=1 Tax=Mesorhizobium sp. M7A.F.Ca.US.014.04.1.1 TaxID=2496744 RepID=UPI000AC75DA8|nr:hypothetical protein [Mesorhizobium sp. M7A.F.Ca.US.014.04.1.1]